MWLVHVQRHKVGSFADLNRADFVFQPHCLGPIDRGHLQNRFTWRGRRIESVHLVQARSPAHVVDHVVGIVARGRIGAQRDVHASLEHFRDRRDAGRKLGVGYGVMGHVGSCLCQASNVLIVQPNGMDQQHPWSDHAYTFDELHGSHVELLAYVDHIRLHFGQVHRDAHSPLFGGCRHLPEEVRTGSTGRSWTEPDLDSPVSCPFPLGVHVKSLLKGHFAVLYHATVHRVALYIAGRVHHNLGQGRPDARILDDLGNPIEAVVPGQHALDKGRCARLEHLQDAQFGADAAIVLVKVAHQHPHPVDQEANEFIVVGAATDQGLGQMDVRVHQSRYHNHALQVDSLMAVAEIVPDFGRFAHSQNPRAVNGNCPVADDAPLGIHRDDCGVLENHVRSSSPFHAPSARNRPLAQALFEREPQAGRLFLDFIVHALPFRNRLEPLHVVAFLEG